MVVNEIWFDMKDGRKALIRSPREEDIPGMLEYLFLSAGETEFILRYPEECGKYTYEGEKALFEEKFHERAPFRWRYRASTPDRGKVTGPSRDRAVRTPFLTSALAVRLPPG